MKRIILLIFIFLFGCGGTKVVLKGEEEIIDFKKFKNIKLEVIDNIKTNYSLGAVHLFDGLLKANLISMGYQLREDGEDLKIKIHILRADPGNKALRIIVGFGAGMARIDYKVEFISKEKIFAEFLGWEGDTWKEQIHWDSDRLRLELVRVAVRKITNFIKEGRKPTESPPIEKD